jgi:DNA-binding transcriptional LysR family regulator
MSDQTGNYFRNVESLGGILAFVHAAEQSSFTAAGRQLGISGSAVGKAVARLEQRLGVRLLHRTTRRVALTDAGGVFYQRARRALEDLREAELALLERSDVPRGRLRVSMPHNIGRLLLLPPLPRFLELYPQVDLDVHLDDRLVDIIGEGFDLVIRTGELADSSLVARRLGPQHFVLCSSPEYFSRHPVPLTPGDLAVHRCIHFRFPASGFLEPWSLCSEYADARIPSSLTFNSSDGLVLAALGGSGIAQLPVYLARAYIDAGRLVPVLTKYMAMRGSIWVAWPSNRYVAPAVRAFADFTIEHLPEAALRPVIPGE